VPAIYTPLEREPLTFIERLFDSTVWPRQDCVKDTVSAHR